MAVLLSCHPSSLPLLSSQCPDYLDPASFFLDPSVSYSDDTLLNRHTAAVSQSIDPANT
ncbi:hypothetical protein [Wolbachia endosymbiont (group A) of Agelastica alni]|uniref:hypothetical protein n=1 Tax=Wolbachia endosymbiont (group A) of Agelastica alni TaxID=3066130 RepID=UPI003132C67E